MDRNSRLSHNGGVRTGESHKRVAKLTFFRRAGIKDLQKPRLCTVVLWEK
jgi:hypothetical protein